MPKIVLVSGDREGYAEGALRDRLSWEAEVGNILVVGGARGVDEQARRMWHYEFQLPYVVHPAPWSRAGKAAGPMRNAAMVRGASLAPHAQLVPDLALYFHHDFDKSKGTRHCYGCARERDIPLELHE